MLGVWLFGFGEEWGHLNADSLLISCENNLGDSDVMLKNILSGILGYLLRIVGIALFESFFGGILYLDY